MSSINSTTSIEEIRAESRVKGVEAARRRVSQDLLSENWEVSRKRSVGPERTRSARGMKCILTKQAASLSVGYHHRGQNYAAQRCHKVGHLWTHTHTAKSREPSGETASAWRPE